jgi:osmotically inducible lipoprotein OsmB
MPVWLFSKGKVMNTKILMSIAAAAVMALSGCASHPTNAQIGTATGAVLGGVAGDALFGNTLGTVGGAAAGAVLGNELGKRR